MQKAMYYQKREEDGVQCLLCPHLCFISNGKTGSCRQRKNIDGTLFSLNYGKTISLSLDPMEKKPLYHFLPGKVILSLGPNSCNLSCAFCQNFSSSQFSAPTRPIDAAQIIELCHKHGSKAVAFTYTEPFTWYEFIIDTAKELKAEKLKIVLVTNGFINREPLQELLPYIDAMNIDLKSMDNEFYKNKCGGKLEPVLDTIRSVWGNCHLEITNLLITDFNDNNEQIFQLVDFIASISSEIPLHFSRYFPNYKLNKPPTPLERMQQAKLIAQEKLYYVYLGNMITDNKTLCPKCGETLIDRRYEFNCRIENGRCFHCGKEIYGVFE